MALEARKNRSKSKINNFLSKIFWYLIIFL